MNKLTNEELLTIYEALALAQMAVSGKGDPRRTEEFNALRQKIGNSINAYDTLDQEIIITTYEKVKI